jgi:hypothetical protein
MDMAGEKKEGKTLLLREKKSLRLGASGSDQKPRRNQAKFVGVPPLDLPSRRKPKATRISLRFYFFFKKTIHK